MVSEKQEALNITSERGLVIIKEQWRICFIYWQKPFDRVNWKNLMELLKKLVMIGSINPHNFEDGETNTVERD